MFFRQLLNDETACASYLLGCRSKAKFAVVDPHVDLVDDYIALAEAQAIPIVAVLETHVQADHISGLSGLVERTGATAYLPEGAGVAFDHEPPAGGDVVIDHRRSDEPWLVLSGDALLVGDAGRPDLHADGQQSAEQMARRLYRSIT